MVHPGLVSVTFRQLAPAEIIALVRQAGLRGIEWGGDIHVPHGELFRARETREMTHDAGLRVAAYGSYYRAGQSESDGLPFARVLETAVELGAPAIRVWAGTVGSVAARPEQRAAVTEDLRRIAGLAAVVGIGVVLEFHNGTLTDTAESAGRLLGEAGHANLATCWQPPINLEPAASLAGLRALLPRLANLHVYQWRQATTERRPLSEGAEAWRSYLAAAAEAPGDRYALLEFVERDAPECFLRDAAVLRAWLGQG
jgi:sugar phosphate isomerase/epimerase